MPLPRLSAIPQFDECTEWMNRATSDMEWRGKAVLVHFWAVSCGLCKEELPIINHWHHAYGDHPEARLQVIGVHTPRTEHDHNVEAIKSVIRQYDLEHPIALDQDGQLASRFQNDYFPAYYLFDEQHRLRHYQAGDRNLQLLNDRLLKVLGVSD